MSKEIKFKSIKEMLEDWLSDETRSITSGGAFHARDLLTWHNILNDTPAGNYVIFNNAGGSPFHIWRDNTGGLIKHMLEKELWSVYAYHQNGVDIILQPLPKY